MMSRREIAYHMLGTVPCLLDALQSFPVPVPVGFNATVRCDERVNQLTCPVSHDGNLSTCCVLPECSTAPCDLDIMLHNPLNGSLINVTSYPTAEVLQVVPADGEAFPLHPNSTLGLSTDVIIAICVVGAFLFIIAVVARFVCWRKRRRVCCRWQRGTSPNSDKDCAEDEKESNGVRVPLDKASEHGPTAEAGESDKACAQGLICNLAKEASGGNDAGQMIELCGNVENCAVATLNGNVAEGTGGGNGAGQAMDLRENVCISGYLPVPDGEQLTAGDPPDFCGSTGVTQL